MSAVSTLALQLAGPMQSWGSASRFSRRTTDDAPTKSGIVGLLAAAAGRRRSDSIENLAAIRLGVRIDQPGTMMRDYHTALVTTGGKGVTQLSERFYLSDAVFLVAIEGGQNLIEGMADALSHPVFPLSLGRRSCVPARRLLLGVFGDEMSTVLEQTPWLVTERVRSRADAKVTLETIIDCAPGTRGSEVRRDEPVSFDPIRREYGWRSVLRSSVTVSTATENEEPSALRIPPVNTVTVPGHDPFDLL
ncbi:type I-E CRISPR-associated protein Cas5/CasD [Jatrophihabitans lederbergiae]|uniref:Type I-E CRISPR-associated protein Cas5/CasD n=1 Tax=Jatrophihabitans lederbergiae TaxID=3075547 RepID=A0ABU2J5P9_9ACTN|nr:type I-E CRISPR-associated protein Cas5/CasD [Jatrophihabitans sp. DSM 44399]MDT0260061.1 type I-E CRISPR-associated protein Cas5/CasD [Jatrophihabitans sp. DSM 44399]